MLISAILMLYFVLVAFSGFSHFVFCIVILYATMLLELVGHISLKQTNKLFIYPSILVIRD